MAVEVNYARDTIDTGNGYFHKVSMANLTGDQLLTANFLLKIVRIREDPIACRVVFICQHPGLMI
jgi:hypothetical protein